MTDDFDSRPPQPKTRELPAADRTEIQMAEIKQLLITGIGALDAKVAMGFQRLEANIELQGVEIGLMKKEVGLLYAWKGDVDIRLKNNSMRARSPSSFDMEQDAKHAQTLMQLDEANARVAHLEKNTATKADLVQLTNAQTTAIITTLSTAANNPTVRKIGYALAGLIIIGIQVLTTYLTNRGHP